MNDMNEKAFIGDLCVSTVKLFSEHSGGMWFETYIFPANGEKITGWAEVWGERYATEDEAVAGHADVCSKLRAGTLEDYNGDLVADPAGLRRAEVTA